MKIEKTALDNHEVKLDVTVEAEEFAPMMAKAAKKIAASQRIPGFRPGKAPANVIRNLFGETAIAQEACDLFLEQKYADILKEADVEPGAMGRLESIDEINPPKFTLVIPLAATVDLGNYREIREEVVNEEVTEEEFKKAMDSLKEPYATAEPAEGAIEEGESVYVMIKGELDEALEGMESNELFAEMPYEIVIGSDSDADSAWPYPEYSKSLIGHQVDETVISEYTYPEDTPMASLKGRKLTVTATIQSIKKMVMPEEDDDFAKNFGEKYESFQQLADEVRARLQAEKDRVTEDKAAEKIISKLVEGSEIKFSPAALEDEVESKLNEIKENLKNNGIEFETWLKMQKKDAETFINEEIRPTAEDQLKRRLVLQEFAQKEKIGMDFEKFKAAANDISAYMQGQIMAAKTKKQRDAIQQQITNMAMNESYLSSVFGRLISIAKGENPSIEPETPADDAVSTEQSLAEAAAKAAAEAGAQIEAEKEA